MSTKVNLQINDASPALKHAAKVFFVDVCNLSLSIVDHFSDSKDGINIEYSTKNDLHVIYLQQAHIQGVNPEVDFSCQNVRFPYKTSDQSFLPFDPIALTWLLMLLPQEQLKECDFDQHHRPVSSTLWIVKNKLHQFPLIDIAAKMFLTELELKFPDFVFPTQKPIFQPTFDIDIAFAHKSKSLLLHGLGSASLLVKLDYKNLQKRLKVWVKKESDPYDVFDELLDVLGEAGLQAIFFAMTANRSKYDKNNNHASSSYRKLLKKLSENHTVGLHPGYVSATKPSIVPLEKMRLENIIGKQVTQVRQHFLRQFLPNSWDVFVENGFTDDYSIGFATHSGYKVGTCRPYQAFDVVANKELPLMLHPFAMMDTALSHYQGNNSAEILEQTTQYLSNTTIYQSPISAVWHNYAMPAESEALAIFKKQISIFHDHDSIH